MISCKKPGVRALTTQKSSRNAHVITETMNEVPVSKPLRFSPIFTKTSGIAREQTNQSVALLELKYAIRNIQ